MFKNGSEIMCKVLLKGKFTVLGCCYEIRNKSVKQSSEEVRKEL